MKYIYIYIIFEYEQIYCLDRIVANDADFHQTVSQEHSDQILHCLLGHFLPSVPNICNIFATKDEPTIYFSAFNSIILYIPKENNYYKR